MERIYLIQCYLTQEETNVHYVLSAHKTKSKAIEECIELIKSYEKEGWRKIDSDDENGMGTVMMGHTMRYYWINEIKLDE